MVAAVVVEVRKCSTSSSASVVSVVVEAGGCAEGSERVIRPKLAEPAFAAQSCEVLFKLGRLSSPHPTMEVIENYSHMAFSTF